jgi:hypothetical protein
MQTSQLFKIFSSIIAVLIIIILVIVITKLARPTTVTAPMDIPLPSEEVSPALEEGGITEEEEEEEEEEDTTPPAPVVVAPKGDVVHPAAPGKWVADAVFDNLPTKLSTGPNTLNLSIRGTMFFEGTAHYTIHDGETGNYVTGGMIQAQMDSMTTNYVPAIAMFTLPSYLSGHRIIFRVLNDNPTGNTYYDKYWGKVIQVQ